MENLKDFLSMSEEEKIRRKRSGCAWKFQQRKQKRMANKKMDEILICYGLQLTRKQ